MRPMLGGWRPVFIPVVISVLVALGAPLIFRGTLGLQALLAIPVAVGWITAGWSRASASMPIAWLKGMVAVGLHIVVMLVLLRALWVDDTLIDAPLIAGIALNYAGPGLLMALLAALVGPSVAALRIGVNGMGLMLVGIFAQTLLSNPNSFLLLAIMLVIALLTGAFTARALWGARRRPRLLLEGMLAGALAAWPHTVLLAGSALLLVAEPAQATALVGGRLMYLFYLIWTIPALLAGLAGAGVIALTRRRTAAA